MMWLTWRQHRAEALALALFVAAVGVLLLMLGLPMHHLFPQGAAHCAVPPLDHACRDGLTQLQQSYGYAVPMLILFNLVPFAIGAFLGAPLLARELAAGTGNSPGPRPCHGSAGWPSDSPRWRRRPSC